MKSIDSIIDAFPHSVIPSIQGTPTYETISSINELLNANAASVHSDSGDGVHGLLILTVSTTTFEAISTAPFETPINPGLAPYIPRGSRKIEINELNRHHNIKQRVWREFIATDKALKQLLIGGVDQIFIRAKRHRITWYANVTTIQLLQHLYETYGKITAAALADNDK